MENLKFEESFKDAFNGAEIAPSCGVWTNVELGLEKTSGGKMRGRLLFFQLLAAASLLFAMGTGGVYFLDTKYDAAQPIAQQESNHALLNQNEKTSVDKSAIDFQMEKRKSNTNSENRNQFKLIAGNDERPAEIESLIAAPSEGQASNESEIHLISGKRPLPRLVEFKKPSFKTSANEPDPGMVLLAKLRDDEKKYQKDKPDLNEKFWASVGMGAGSYNPNNSASNVMLTGLSGVNSSSPSTSDPTSGTSYSVGVSVAGKVSKRIVLQGGISYLSQNSTYTSNIASGAGGAFLNEYATISRDETLSLKNQIIETSPYQVNNNLQYMSIPLQAGYIIIDQDFAFQLNGGISTDIFFQNTLTPKNSDLDEVTHGAGSDSPYRTINFSGLLGTELSYRVGDHYRVAINPGMRYALNSIYKSDVTADVSPLTFDVALRFRYMF